MFLLRVSVSFDIGFDWYRGYTIQGDVDLTHAKAVCKVRNTNDDLIVEADCYIEGNTVYVLIPAAKSLTIPKSVFKGFYDVFITSDTYSYKLVMGSVKIIHEISLH